MPGDTGSEPNRANQQRPHREPVIRQLRPWERPSPRNSTQDPPRPGSWETQTEPVPVAKEKEPWTWETDATHASARKRF